MKRWGCAVVLLALSAAACWKTKPNPRYCDEPGAMCDGGVDQDGGRDMVARCTASSCSGATPICDTSGGTCRACMTADCPGSVCDTAAADPAFGQCVECVDDTPCGGKICESNKCVPCTKHSDCANVAGICDLDAGTCAPNGGVIYVDDVVCTNGTKDGSSPANAFCQVNDALAVVTSTKKYVKVAGNGNANLYNAIVWAGSTALDVQIVGPGKEASVAGGGAVFSDAGKPALLVQPTADATMTVDGLELIGSNASAKSGASLFGRWRQRRSKNFRLLRP